MREVDWLLHSADWVVTCDPAMRCVRPGAVAIEGEEIVAAGPSDELRRTFRGRKEMDLSGHLLLPGLVNTHTHAAMSVFRGMGDDLPLGNWLRDVIFPAEAAAVSPDMVYWGTLLSAVEMLKGGTTTFCDGYFFEEHAARAALDAGMRAVLGQGVLDFPAPDQPDPKKSRARVEEFFAAFPAGEARLRPSIFCHAPYTCGSETLRWVKELCRQNGILFQMHLSETAGEVREIVAKTGMRPAVYLEHLGILDPMTLCVHAVWLDSREIEILAQTGAAVSHCPESNMKLGSGVARVTDMIAAGVRVGLGTDGCASNNNQDMLSEMDKAAKLEKVFRRDPVAGPARKVLHLATLGGAEALGLGRETGSIEPGKKADLAAIDLNQPHLFPVYDPVSLLVYSARAGDVRHVWVSGRQVVADGGVTTVSETEAMDQVRKIARKCGVCWEMGKIAGE